MPKPTQSKARAGAGKLLLENAELRLRLEEAQQALEAIRTGQVDSLVVEGADGPRIFSVEGATQSYRVLVESMNEGAATLRADGTILYCNARLARMLGEPLQQVMGGSLRLHVAEPDRAAFDALLARARHSAAREELALRASDGERVPSYLSVSSIVDERGPVLCLVATDLREQKRAEAIRAAERAARLSEERLRLTLRHASAAAWEWDLRSGALVWSPESYELYGVDRVGAPLTRADWERAVHPADLPAMAAALGDCIEGRSDEFRREFRVVHPRLGDRWLLGVGKVERAEDGTAVRMLGLTLDITERKRAEEALREADRRKDEFLGMLSHELRNPLAPIRSSAYLLRSAEPGSDLARRAQEVIERQTRHLTRLVDDLLDVTRIAHGKMGLHGERVELRDLVRRTAEDLRSVVEGGGATFRVDVADEEMWAHVDATRVAQVIGNLLQNAAKFTGRGGSVTLSLERDGTDARIRVRDTGAGIDPALLPRVFDPFVQGDRTLARTGGGLGLGLALVKGIVELHGGTVVAGSGGVGRGAEFTLSLPLGAPSPARGRPPSPKRRSGRRVLVVDDNVDAAESLAEALRVSGWAVDVAFDGPTAIDKAEQDPPDVVLCDIGLPGMDGYEVVRRLRALGTKGMQLIAVSGYAQPGDVRKAVEAGFDGHIAKPCDPDQIEQLLA